MSKMDGLLHRQLNRIYRRECHQLGRHINAHKQSKPQSERIVCESDDILSYGLDEKSLPGVYIAAKPLQPELNDYFEIEVIESSSVADIAIGLVSSNHPLDQLPGFVSNSVGYHAGDGRFVHSVEYSVAKWLSIDLLKDIFGSPKRNYCGRQV